MKLFFYKTILTGVLMVWVAFGQAQAPYIKASTQIGGSSMEQVPAQPIVINGYSYILNNGYSSDFPVTVGPSISGDAGNGRVSLVKLNNNDGSITWSTTLPAPANISGVYASGFAYGDNAIYISGQVANPTGFFTTDGTTSTVPYSEFLVKIDATSGKLVYSTIRKASGYSSLSYYNGKLYGISSVDDPNYPVTDGSTYYDNPDLYYGTRDVLCVYDAASGQLKYATWLKQFNNTINVDASGIKLVGYSLPTNTTTDGTVVETNTQLYQPAYTFMDISNYSTLVATVMNSGSDDYNDNMFVQFVGNNIYVVGETIRPENVVTTNGTGAITSPGSVSFYYFNINANTGAVNSASVLPNTWGIRTYDITNQYFVLAESAAYRETILTKIDLATGNIVATKTVPYYVQDMDYNNGKYHFFGWIYNQGSPNAFGMPVTNGSVNMGGSGETYYTLLDDNFNMIGASYIGDEGTYEGDFGYIYSEGDDGIILNYSSYGFLYPVTNNTLHNPATSNTNSDITWTRFSMCATQNNTIADVISPANQQICVGGSVAQLQGVDFNNGSTSNLPTIYRNGAAYKQGSLPMYYQWQTSTDQTNWTNIANATDMNYTPGMPTTSPVYYRRLVLSDSSCGPTIISTSQVATITIDQIKVAPVANAGGLFTGCPGSSFTLGGTPIATGGVAPYTILWDNGLGSTTNPTVAPTSSNAYSLRITDANGCTDYDTAIVNIYKAYAGADGGVCAGTGIKLGGLPAAGMGATYAWSPASGLSCTTCPNPIATISTPQTYTLSVTLPVTGGGTCTTTDVATTTPTTGPVTPNFAGNDQVICLDGTTVDLGYPIQPSEKIEYSFSAVSTNGNVALTPISNLSDANYTTGLASPNVASSYITIDLGAIKDVKSVSFAAQSSTGLNGHYLYVSDDGVTFRNITYTSATNTALQTQDIWGNTNIRYIKFQKAGTGVTNLSEFKAIGNKFAYTWAPGSYLWYNNQSTTTVDFGNINMPQPNPITYYLTAVTNGCSFYDSVVVAAIEARADIDGCGPRTVGLPDRTPNISETYTWTKISGPGNFTGATNEPVVPVSASIGGTTIYELKVSATINGIYHECTDQVVVPDCGCNVDIEIDAPYDCPNFDANDGNVTMTAKPMGVTIKTFRDIKYDWSPKVGLSNYDSATVRLTDGVERTYTVTISSPYDPDWTCSTTKTVNLPVVSLPQFNAQDGVVCAGTPVNIGSFNVLDYTYAWWGGEGLSQYNVSNPSATPTSTTTYYVKVIDTQTGCSVLDTAKVLVANPPASAGMDNVACGQDVVTKLGGEPVANTTYSWTADNATFSYQNGTNNSSPQPEVKITQTTTFYMVATDGATGCQTKDTVKITYGAAITPFNLTDLSYCPGAATAVAVTAPAGYSSYAWSPGALVLNATSASTSLASPKPSVQTTLSLTVKNSAGCSFKTSRQLIPTTTAPNAGNNASVCYSATPGYTGTVQLGGPAEVGATYSWSPTAGLSSATISNPVFTPTSTMSGLQNYTVTKTDAGGCASTAKVSVFVSNMSIPAIPDVVACQNSKVQIGTTPVEGTTYVWDPATGLSNQYAANPFVTTGTQTQIYTLTATNSMGCKAQETVSVTVSNTQAPQVSIPNQTVCASVGYAYINAIVTPSTGSYNYTWSPNDGTLNNIYAEDPIARITNLGNYNFDLLVVDNVTGCSNFASTTVTAINCNASLGDKVWRDDNKDGVQDKNEPGVAGVIVTLYQNGADGLPGTADDVVVGTAITDANGNYLFSNLTPTDFTNATTTAQTSYHIKVTPPANYSFSPQTNTTDNQNNLGSDVNVLGVSHTVALSAGENDLTVDAGLIFKQSGESSSIGDKVWFDANGDGLQANDANEPGVAGVVVTLYDGNNNILAATITDANGNYLFTGLPNNGQTYYVGVSAPAGTVLTTSTGTTPTANDNSDINPATGLSGAIVMPTGGSPVNYTGVDAGITNASSTNTGSLGDKVWNDTNHDGIQDANEPGVPGVTMNLYRPGPDGLIGGDDDILVGTTTTDINGNYVFNNLIPGQSYFVVATVPSGYQLTSFKNGTDRTMDNNFNASSIAPYSGKAITDVVTLPATGVTRDMTIDLGIYNSTTNLGSIGDYVWFDANKDGQQDASEMPVSGVTVSLLNSSGAVILNPATGDPYVVMTDAKGKYIFTDLPAGDYKVKFSNIPTGYSFTQVDALGTGNAGSATDAATDSDVFPGTGLTSTIFLGAGQHITSVDAGLVQGLPAGTASLGDYVWYDANGNGLQDGNETGVPNVKVYLLDANDNVVNVPGTNTPYVVYTDGAGKYMFTGLPAGDYKVEFANLPNGYTSSPANNSNMAANSDASFSGTSTSTTSAKTGLISLATGQDNMTIDFGLVPPATANNAIGDYVWIDSDANGTQDLNEPKMPGVIINLYNAGTDGLVGTADDKFYGSTVSDNDGKYYFTGLPDGLYYIAAQKPNGYNFTYQETNQSATGSNVNNLGASKPISLDPTSSIATPVNDLTIDVGLVTTRAALGDYVWLDVDADGIQDATESGISGVTVTLYNNATGEVIATAITNDKGYYFFPNLDPSVKYDVGFTTIPSGLSFTSQNTTSDDLDSDVDPISGLVKEITLTAGAVNTTIDAGLKPSVFAALGDYVWSDADGDGFQTIGESGVPGILVTLYAADNTVVGTAITNGDGLYQFDKLKPGSYWVLFSNIPVGTNFTVQNEGTSNGSDASSSTGGTSIVTLAAGEYNPNIDAGILMLSPLPVKLISFDAVAKDCDVIVKWQSAEELNFSKFIVEKSFDGIQFSSIANVNTVGAAHTYTITHKSDSKGTAYYRLKMVDNDGTFKYSEIKRVVTNCGVYAISVNPTLTTSSTIVKGLKGTEQVKVVGANGQVVKNLKAIANTMTIDLSGYTNGVYQIMITNAGKLVLNAKVVKQ